MSGYSIRCDTRKDARGEDHTVVIESTSGVVACGASFCDGRCGFPALVLCWEGVGGLNEAKAHGSQVACGPVFQGFRVAKWTGEKVPVTAGTNAERLFDMKWW